MESRNAISKRIIFTTIVIICMAWVPPSQAEEKGKASRIQPVKTREVLVCPVVGDPILPKLKAKMPHSTYKGVTYYFCCPPCKPQFDKNPEKYLKGKPGSTMPKHQITFRR